MRYAALFVVMAGAAALAFGWTRHARRHAGARRGGETAVSATWLFRQQRSDDQ